MPREDKEDRDQRIDKEKDKKNLITENNEYGKNADETVLSENVIDVYDIISHSTDPNIIKLRKLIEYGINEEMIVKIYEGQSSNVENKESAIDILSKMYEDLVKYINKMPNGIVINPNTGEKDDDASRKQAAQVGIADELEHDRFQQIGEQYFIEKINKQFTNQTGEKEVLKTAIRFDKKVFDKDKFSFDKEFEDFIRKRQKEYKQQVIENVISTTLDDVQALIDSSINISEIALKERIKFAGPMLLALLKGDRHKGEPGRATDLIKKLYPDLDGEGDNTLLANLASIVLNKEIDEKDPMKIVDAVEEIEKLELKKVDREASKRLDIDDKVLSMEARLAITDKSTPEYEILLKEIKNFYKQNPECIEFADSLKDENGNLTIEAQSKVSKYINDLRDSIINSKIEKFEKCDKSKLTDEEKKHFTSIFLVGAGTESNKDLSTKSQEILLEMYPEMKTNSKEDLLKNIVGMVLENDPKSPNNDYKEKIASMTQVLNQVLVTEDSQRMQKVSEKHIDEFYEKESVQLAVSYDITKSIVQNTFNESNINFTKQDEESFNNLYKECSVNTWIGKKEDIIYHRYMALLDVQEKIDSNPPGTMMDKSNEKTIKRMLAQIREKPEIQAFEEKLSTYTPEELAEYKKSEAEFRKAKMEAKVLDVFSKKVIHHDVNYHDMTTGGKQEYLKIIIYARELAEASTDPKEKDMLMKLSNRGLELMNTEEKKFITFDENGNPNIDEGLLIDEYKSRISTRGKPIENIKDLQKYTLQKYSDLYIVAKLYEYERLEKDDFVELQSDTPESKLVELNQIKKRKNIERLKKRQEQEQAKAKETGDSESTKKEDVVQNPHKHRETNTGEEQVKNEQSSENENLPVVSESIFSKIRRSFNNAKQNVLNFLENNKIFSKIKNIFSNNKDDKKEILDEKHEYSPKNDFDSRISEGVNFDGRLNQDQIEASKKEGMPEKSGKETDDLTV